MTNRLVAMVTASCVLLMQDTVAAQEYDRAWLFCSADETTSSVALGDLDDDGDLDVVFGNGRHWAEDSRYAINDGAGWFGEGLTISGGQKTYAIALADLDGDGDLDGVEATDFGDYVFILLNNGRGVFSKGAIGLDAQDTRRGRHLAARHTVVADFDGDGRPDPVVITRGTGNWIFRNLGDGNRYSPYLLEGPRELLQGPGRETIKAAVGDLDGDGDLDLAVAARGLSVLYLNEGDLRFSVYELPGEEAEATAVALADLDGNGQLDIALGIEDGFDRLYLNPLSADARMEEWGDPLGGVRDLEFADMDGDGDLDLVAARTQLGFEMVGDDAWITPLEDSRSRIHWNDDGDLFTRTTLFGQSGVSTRDLAIGDLDADGRLDIVLANDCGANLVLFGPG